MPSSNEISNAHAQAEQSFQNIDSVEIRIITTDSAVSNPLLIISSTNVTIIWYTSSVNYKKNRYLNIFRMY